MARNHDLRVLLVDDSPGEARTSLEALAASGRSILSERAETVARLAEVLGREPWNLVLTEDIPPLDALEVLAVLRDASLDIPLVVVTRAATETRAVLALRGGAKDYLGKPDLSRLGAVVERELGRDRDHACRSEVEARRGLAQPMASMGMLAAGLAHALSNPLAAVAANLEVLERDLAEAGSQPVSLGPRLVETLADVRVDVHRICRVARDLKLLSRPDDARRSSVCIHSMLEVAVRLVGYSIRNRTIRLVCGPLPTIEASGPRLTQVFLDLLVALAQTCAPATDRGQITVTAEFRPPGDVVVTLCDEVVSRAPAVGAGRVPLAPTIVSAEAMLADLGGQLAVDSPASGLTIRLTLPTTTTRPGRADTIQAWGTLADP
jgi:signal transduction histidine kinase